MFKGKSFISALALCMAFALGSCGSGEISDELPRLGDPSDPTQPGTGNPPADPFPEVDPTCPSAATVANASNGWSSTSASEAALDTLDFEVMARPGAGQLDGLVALGSQRIGDFSDAAILVRFAVDGLIDARDGPAYDRDVDFRYEAGAWYEIAISANLATRTYDVEVGRCGEPREALITGAAFRSDATVVDRLTDWAVYTSTNASLEVSTPSWIVSGSCASATCESLVHECGQPSDGCGGNLSCGACPVDEACVIGACVDVSPPPPGDGGELPGGPADSCSPNEAISAACICGGAMHDAGFCCDEGFSFSTCSSRARYVRPGGGGARDGSDWANSLDGLPSSLERDTVYWVGAGSYGSYTFDDATNGEAGITVRKATAEAHGTDAGWSAAYGSSQAVFGPLRFNTSRYTVDGGEPNGIKTVGKMGTNASAHIGGSRIVLRHVEIDGGVQKSNDTQTAGGCMGGKLSGSYVVLDRCDIHNVADDGLDISGDHIKVLYSKIHDLHGCGTDAQCSGPCYNGHSDGIEFTGVTDLQLIGNMVYDGQSNAALFMWGADNYDFVAYNNIFYTPATGASIYLKHLHGAKLHNNIIWGRTNGNRFGGLFIGKEVTDLQMYNNIILCINYSHMGSSHDPNEHDLDYNLYGMINSGEYTANTNDLIANPQFVGVPMSSDRAAHKGSELRLEDFVPTAAEALDTGTASGDVPTFDIAGQPRPLLGGWDRGAFEAAP